MLLPTAAWYFHAARLTAARAGAAAANLDTWLRALAPTALLEPDTWAWIARHGLLRAFLPVVVLLAAAGGTFGRGTALWRAWAAAAAVTLLAVAAKLHHEYYWLLLAPPVAATAAEALSLVLRIRPDPATRIGLSAAASLLAAAAFLSTSATWRTPNEWLDLPAAGRRIAEVVPLDSRLIAREAVLYAADRRGFRMEYEPDAVRRALAEWGRRPDAPEEATPGALLGWYHRQGGRFFAEVGGLPAGTDLPATLRAATRRVWIDEPGLLLVELAGDDEHHGRRDPEVPPR
jgi:hypothetical protein